MRALIYHDVTESSRFDESGFPGATAAAYKLEPRIFERHLDAIAGSRYAPGIIASDASLPEVALTFDDGGASAMEIAAMLERRGWRGHFFIATARIGSAGFVTAGQVRELAARGHLVGSHTHTHPAPLSRLPEGVIADEWRVSRELLADLLGAPPQLAGVPGGDVSPVVVATARDAGYRYLMTSEPTRRTRDDGDLTVVGRYTIWSSTSPSRAAALADGSSLALSRSWLGWNAKKLVKRVAPSAYRSAREAIRARGARS
jgi:peptidoglycan/xylan/chitin deacetylase (PgdA/CDA1 family)